MDQHSRLEYAHQPLQLPQPKVDIIIANTRGAEHPWFIKALQTCQQQTYPNVGQLVVYNNDRALSIGAAWNLGVANSDAELVLFVGDDDMISVDLVSHLVGIMAMVEAQQEQPLWMVTSFCTLIDADDRPIQPAEQVSGIGAVQKRVNVQHTGLWRRDRLLDVPFDNELSRGVGRAHHHKLAQAQKERQRFAPTHRLYHASAYHYGYHYRQHVGMASQENYAHRLA